MSADNGIYIVQFKDGFRIAHRQAIENIFEGDDFLLSYFDSHDVIVCDTLIQANHEAERLYESYGWIEYGICLYDQFKDRNFADIQKEVNGNSTVHEG